MTRLKAYLVKEPAEGAGVDSLIRLATLHRVSLARPSLSVRKNADVVTVEYRGHEGLHLIKHLLLGGIRTKCVVKLKHLLASLGLVEHGNGVVLELGLGILDAWFRV